MIDFNALSAPFPPEAVSWRVGSTTQDKKRGLALAYLDSRDVQGRLDEVCGPAGWQCRYPHAAGKTICEIGIKIGDEWVWKADGAGDSDIEAEKGAISDAFKRAAVKWGIGRYLYDIESPWVALDQYKKIEESEKPKLLKALGGTPKPAQRAVPQTRLPEGKEPVSSNDGHKLTAEALKMALRKAETPVALKEWWTTRNTQEALLGLPESFRTEVIEAKTLHLEALKEGVGA